MKAKHIIWVTDVETLEIRFKWTEERIQRLRELYPDLTNQKIGEILGTTKDSVDTKAFKLGLKKSKGFRKRLFELTGGNSGNWKKGCTSWRKGKKGIISEGGKATWFQKGHSPSFTKPIGTVNLHFDTKTNRIRFWYKVSQFKWVPYAHYLFSQWYGEVPKGMYILHKNGNRLDFRLENLECVSPREYFLRQSGAVTLSEGFVVATMIGRSVQGEERERLKEAFLGNKELIEVKRNILKLKRACRKETEL